MVCTGCLRKRALALPLWPLFSPSNRSAFQSICPRVALCGEPGFAAEERSPQHQGTLVNIALIDYGAGNVPSVERAVGKLGSTMRRVTRPEELSGTKAIILPGVGHYAAIIRAF